MRVKLDDGADDSVITGSMVLYPPDSFLFTVPLKRIKGFDARKRRSWSR